MSTPPIIDTDIRILEEARRELERYTARNSWWRRLISGKWGRKNLKDVRQLLAMMRDLSTREANKPAISTMKGSEDTVLNYPVQNCVDLLCRLQRITLKPRFNPKGALAGHINSIWTLVLNNRYLLNQSAIDTQPGYFKNIHTEKNGLILVMTHRPEETAALYGLISQLEGNAKTGILQHALLYMMGERHQVIEWALDLPALTGKPGTVVDWDYTGHLPALFAAMADLSFDQRKNVLLPALIRACQLGRTDAKDHILSELFEHMPTLSGAEGNWINKMLSRVTRDDNAQLVLHALNNAIREDRIHVPLSRKLTRTQTELSLFANRLPRGKQQIYEKLNELTRQEGWTFNSDWRKKFIASLYVSVDETETITRVTQVLERLQKWGILDLKIRQHVDHVSFHCSNISNYKLSMTKPSHIPEPEVETTFTHSI